MGWMTSFLKRGIENDGAMRRVYVGHEGNLTAEELREFTDQCRRAPLGVRRENRLKAEQQT